MLEKQIKNRSTLNSINYLRVLAVMMILYDHIGGLRNPEWIVKRGIDYFVTVPLNIIQDFGALGVSIFFLISGLLFTYNANFENPVKKRVASIFL